MSEPLLSGSLAFLPTATFSVDAGNLPRAGVAVRAPNELLIIGEDVAFMAKLRPDDLETLAGLLLHLADQQRAAAAGSAKDALSRIVTASGDARA